MLQLAPDECDDEYFAAQMWLRLCRPGAAFERIFALSLCCFFFDNARIFGICTNWRVLCVRNGNVTLEADRADGADMERCLHFFSTELRELTE